MSALSALLWPVEPLGHRRVLVMILIFVSWVLCYTIWLDRENTLTVSQFEEELKSQAAQDDDEEEEEGEEMEVETWAPFDPNEVRLNKDIFLLETKGLPFLSYRQGCVAEAASLHHPDRRIFILFITSNITEEQIFLHDVMRNLLVYPNIRLRYISPSALLSKSPLFSWFVYSDWHLTPSMPRLLHHALALLLLHKHGGTVLSWDALLLGRLPLNTIGQCEFGHIGLHVLSLDAKHPLLTDILSRLHPSQNPDDLGDNVIKNALKDICKVEHISELEYKECGVMPRLLKDEAFCPVEKDKYWIMFDNKRRKLARGRIDKKRTKAVNLWTELSGGMEVWAAENKKSLVYEIARENCPIIFEYANYTL